MVNVEKKRVIFGSSVILSKNEESYAIIGRQELFNLIRHKPTLVYEQTLSEILTSKDLSFDAQKYLIDYASRPGIHPEIQISYRELIMRIWDKLRTSDIADDICKKINHNLKYVDIIERIINSIF